MAYPAELIRAEIYSQFAGSNVINVLHFTSTLPINNSTLNSLCSELQTKWIQPITIHSSANGYAYNRVRAWYPGSPLVSAAQQVFVRGGTNGESMPVQVAVRFRLDTGGLGRRGQGRYFMAGVPQGNCTGGLLNALGTQRCGSIVVAWDGAFIAETRSTPFRLVVWSRAAQSAYNVQLVTYDNAFSTIRTRKVGIGY